MTDFEHLRTELMQVSQVDGIVPVDILNLPEEIGVVIRGMVRDRTITPVELAAALAIRESEAFTAAEILVQKGYLLVVEDHTAGGLPRFRIRFARMRRHNIPSNL